MKTDVEIPARVPRKRRELERALPAWLATWAADERLPDAERRRAQAERERRRALHPDPVRLGLLVGTEGATPAQLNAMREIARIPGTVEVRAPMPLRLGLAPGVFTRQPRGGRLPLLHEIVKASTSVVAAPRGTERPSVAIGVWEAVRYARHRGVPVRVVMPNGDER